MTYPALNPLQDLTSSRDEFKLFAPRLIPTINGETIHQILNSHAELTLKYPSTALSGVIINCLNFTKAGELSNTDTAFAHRNLFGNNLYQAMTFGRCNEPKDQQALREWLAETQAKFKNKGDSKERLFAMSGAVLTEEDWKTEDKPRAFFGENLEKLREIKKKYDPKVFFDKSPVILPN